METLNMQPKEVSMPVKEAIIRLKKAKEARIGYL